MRHLVAARRNKKTRITYVHVTLTIDFSVPQSRHTANDAVVKKGGEVARLGQGWTDVLEDVPRGMESPLVNTNTFYVYSASRRNLSHRFRRALCTARVAVSELVYTLRMIYGMQ